MLTKYRKPALYLDEFFNDDDIFSPFNSFVKSVFNRDSGSGLVNVSETDSEYELDFILPGYKKEDVEINIDDNTLTVKAERDQSSEDSGKNYIRKEYVRTSFSRTFGLPEDASDSDIDAEMVDGILKLRVKKINKDEKKDIKKIEIK